MQRAVTILHFTILGVSPLESVPSVFLLRLVRQHDHLFESFRQGFSSSHLTQVFLAPEFTYRWELCHVCLSQFVPPPFSQFAGFHSEISAFDPLPHVTHASDLVYQFLLLGICTLFSFRNLGVRFWHMFSHKPRFPPVPAVFISSIFFAVLLQESYLHASSETCPKCCLFPFQCFPKSFSNLFLFVWFHLSRLLLMHLVRRRDHLIVNIHQHISPSHLTQLSLAPEFTHRWEWCHRLLPHFVPFVFSQIQGLTRKSARAILFKMSFMDLIWPIKFVPLLVYRLRSRILALAFDTRVLAQTSVPFLFFLSRQSSPCCFRKAAVYASDSPKCCLFPSQKRAKCQIDFDHQPATCIWGPLALVTLKTFSQL